MGYREIVSHWMVVSVISLFMAVILDASAWAVTAWGWAEEDTYYTRAGLWQICNGTRELSLRDRKEIYRSPPTCVFPTTIQGQDWIPKGLVMEIMGGFCSVAALVVLLVFLAGLRFDWIRSRSVLVALVPLAFLSALMNFIGVMTFAINMTKISCTPDFCVGLDALAVLGFIVGGLGALMEVQGCCAKESPVIGKGLTRPI